MLSDSELEYFADPITRALAIKACRDAAANQRIAARRAKHANLKKDLRRAAEACEARALELEALDLVRTQV